MGMGERDAAVKTFVEDRDCRIFLTSLRAAGVALNLTVASHVFMMEPCWNPFVERQAQARIHRIGQYKPIRVVRFVMENTVEEKILELQEKKDLLFEGTIGGSTVLKKIVEGNDIQQNYRCLRSHEEEEYSDDKIFVHICNREI